MEGAGEMAELRDHAAAQAALFNMGMEESRDCGKVHDRHSNRRV